MPEKANLLPCPFCGHKPSLFHFSTGWAVVCNSPACGVSPEYGDCNEREQAIEGWNRRPAQQEAVAEQRLCLVCGHPLSVHDDGMAPACGWETCACNGFKEEEQ